MTTSPTTLVLVDGSGFIFRGFHALPPLTRPEDGTPVGAVYGFAAMLNKLLAERAGARVLVVFDAGRKSFRTDLYPAYKANRPPPPPELVPQFPLCREAATAFGCPVVELEGYEADDLIASYARAAQEAGQPVALISSDKDLMQLIRPGVQMFDPIKGKEIGLPEVQDKFGVTPDKVGDVLALAGDSSDNIPGAPGIGVKTAAQLLADYGDLESLLQRAGEIKQPKRREALVQNADLIRLSRRLVALDEQAPLPLALDSLAPPAPDPARLLDWLNRQGFRSLAARVGLSSPATATTPDASSSTAGIPSRALPQAQAFGPYACVQDLPTLQRWIARATESGIVAVDTETNSLTPSTAKLVGVSLALAPGDACYLPLGHVGEGVGLLDQDVPPQVPLADAIALLKPLLEDPAVLKVGQNIKFDAQVFAQHGIILTPYDDTMLLSVVLENGLHGHGMDELSTLFLGHKPIPFAEVCGTGKKQITFDQVPLERATAYAAEDADVTLRLWQVLKPRLVAEKQVTLYETIDRPLVRVVAEMERTGVRVDADLLRRLSLDFARRMNALEAEAHALAGHPFNLGSPKQLGEVLFDQMQLPGGVRGKAGAWSTDADVLDTLADQGHLIAAKLLEWRQFQKLRSTYTEALPAQINPRTGRVHTSFSLSAATTGRLSSSDPNLQNIPVRTEEGRSIRRAFVAPEGHVLLSADYSQIELRLLAHVADIPALKQAFRDGVDIHAKTAAEVFGLAPDAVTSDYRRRAKAINFGIIYGISAFGLAHQLGISQAEAGEFIRIYFARFPELRAYMEHTKEQGRQHGFVPTLDGRKCHILGLKDRTPSRRSFAERQAINAPLQGTAADIIKRAMNRLPDALHAHHLAARMLLQVHDELLFEVPVNQVEDTARTVKAVMEGAATLSVPLIVETGTGPNWAEAH